MANLTPTRQATRLSRIRRPGPGERGEPDSGSIGPSQDPVDPSAWWTPEEVPDHYRTLGIEPSATSRAIGAAHRRLSHRLESQLDSSPIAAARLERVRAAHQVLSDPVGRAAYDLAWSLGHTTDSAVGVLAAPTRRLAPKPAPRHPRGRVSQSFGLAAASQTERVLPPLAVPAAGEQLSRVLERLWADRQLVRVLTVSLVLGLGTLLRFWQINALGYNSDEAVYAGQAAAIAEDPTLSQYFPVFRAHPVLFQTLLSVGFRFGVSDLLGRLVAAAVGVATLYVIYLLGRSLYGRRAGVLATLFVAVMPYHVVVTRQVLLDGPMTLFSTLTLFMLARYAATARPVCLYAAGACAGLTFMSKTNGIVILGAVYIFLALSPEVRLRLRDLALSLACLCLVIAPYPLTLMLAGRTGTGQQYLAWQLFRRPNHEWDFYLTTVPSAIGPLVILVALAGLWLLRRDRSWRETLLVAWIVVPVTFFELWPTKGFQYLLPIAPAFAVLAGRTVNRLLDGHDLAIWRWRLPGVRLGLVALGVIAATLFIASWQQVQPSTSESFLAGSGGLPGGREAGLWVRENTPEGAVFLAIGPSMANVVQFYGHRKAYGLSVSPNPLRRNPSYEPVNNPDFLIRNNQIQYVVWDSYSAQRTGFFADWVIHYAEKYHGRAVHTESVTVTTPERATTEKPVIVIYEVRP